MKKIFGTILLLGLMGWRTGTCSAAVKIGAGLGECHGVQGVKVAYMFHMGHSAESPTGEAYFGLGTGAVPWTVMNPVMGIKGHLAGDRGVHASLSVASFYYEARLGLKYVLQHKLLNLNVMGGYDLPLNHTHSLFFSPAVGICMRQVDRTVPMLDLGFDLKL